MTGLESQNKQGFIQQGGLRGAERALELERFQKGKGLGRVRH